MRHRSVRDESNASWSTCMYTYLTNIGPPFLHGDSFSQKYESLIVIFDGSFCSCSLESYLVILTSRRGNTSTYFFAHKPLSKGLPAMHYISCFLIRGIMESALYVCQIAPQFDHVSKCSIWVFLGDEAMWKKIWLFTSSCFHGEFLEFQSYSKKTFWCLFKTNLFWKIQAILIDRFAWVKWCLIGQNGSSFNLKGSKN